MKKRVFFLTLFFIFVFLQNIIAQTEEQTAGLFRDSEITKQDFSKIDDYVKSLKIGRNVSQREMVELITKNSTTKMEKARAIFIWIAENIAYDTSYKITSMEAGLKNRKGVCQAYSGIFEAFGKLAGLEVVSISGDSKQSFYKRPSDLDRGGHAWNAFKADDGRAVLVDATWGAGYVKNKKFTREFTDFWFDTPPKIFVFTHFPEDKKWQLLETPISREKFLTIPPLSPKFINWGLNVDELFSHYMMDKHDGFPDYYSVNVDWKIIKMPISATLKRGTTYEFIFEIDETEEIAIVLNESDWVMAEKEGNRQTITVTPTKRGSLLVMLKQKGSSYTGALKYAVN